MTKAKLNIESTKESKSTFDEIKRQFEKSHFAQSVNYADDLQTLAKSIAYSAIRKLVDPQGKTATEKDAVTNSGVNPVMVSMKRAIYGDLALLAKTARLADLATAVRYNADGNAMTEVIDKMAEEALAKVLEETLEEGIDLVQEACLALLEQAEAHSHEGEGWLDRPFTIRRLKRKVLIKATDSASYEEVETTPIQEVYRAVRRMVQNSRAVQTDPRNGYLYIEDITADGLDTIYHRLQKWADLGGADCYGHYTADLQTSVDYDRIITALGLTDRQMTIVNLRMKGYGTRAIGSYMGVSQGSIDNALKAVRKKAEAIGFIPSMWAEMTAE